MADYEWDMSLLARLGDRVRALRRERGWTQSELARRAHLSPRFVAQLESGRGNISLLRLDALAQVLGVKLGALVDGAAQKRGIIALIGLRGAGKSSVGARLAKRLGVRFLELDKLIEDSTGLELGEIFELHGEGYYRRVEQETLARVLNQGTPAVLAVGGGLPTHPDSFRLLKEATTTVWLKARAQDHWNRVLPQGDQRPMKAHPQAMSELRALLHARGPLYAEAEHVVDTSRLSVDAAVERLAQRLS
jgi:XRE family aerobic/anaerobic benzoate catabolism transcriptional regulator